MIEPDVSVVMPCLNEEESVGACIDEARSAFTGAGMTCEVIVADNGSTDRSREVAVRAGARVIDEPIRGYGAAVSSGIAASKGTTILISDSDGTYSLHQGPDLVRAAADGAVAVGSRFAGRIEAGAMPTLHRLVGSPATRLLLALLFGVRTSDPHSGLRAMRRDVFERVRPHSTGWEFTVEMLVNARRRGIGISEVPITYARRRGASKLRALRDGWGFFKFLILHSPTFLYIVPAVVAMSLGASLLGWLAPTDRRLGEITLGVNSLVVGALLTIVGHQIAVLGLAAKAHLRDLEAGGGRPSGPHVPRWFSLERGVACGAILLAAGLSLVAAIGVQWWSIGFAPLSRASHGLVIVGATVAAMGTQSIFGSFFLAIIADPFSRRSSASAPVGPVEYPEPAGH